MSNVYFTANDVNAVNDVIYLNVVNIDISRLLTLTPILGE